MRRGDSAEHMLITTALRVEFKYISCDDEVYQNKTCHFHQFLRSLFYTQTLIIHRIKERQKHFKV